MKHRHVRVKIYRKTTRYPFFRIAYRAEGRRVVRSFKTYAEARSAAKSAAKPVASGNEGAATLSVSEVQAVKFARCKLNELSIDLNLARTDTAAPEISLSLEDAIAEFTEAKRALGSGRLIEAVKAYRS